MKTKKNRVRLPPAERAEQILNAAIDEAIEVGYQNVMSRIVAEKVGIAQGTIRWHYGAITELRRCVMKRAVDQNIAIIVAQGLTARDPIALRASEAVRKKARAYIN